MNTQNQQSPPDQLQRIEGQLNLLAGRVEYIERRLGIRMQPSTPGAAPVDVVPIRDTGPAPQTPAPRTSAPHPRVPLLPQVPPMEDEPSQQPGPVAAPSMVASGQAYPTLQTAPATGNQTPGAIGAGVDTPDLHGSRLRHHQETNDWERLIGGKWALWVGSVAVFLAVAFFLAYTWSSLPPAGRLAIGFVAGALFLGAGGFARTRLDNWFSEGLAGAGLGIFYLSIWTGAQSYGLLSFEVAFILMAATTVLGVGLAVHFDAVSLSALSTLGGFLTPVLLDSSGGGGSPLPFMAYVSLLNIGILIVSLFKRWNGIVWLSFIATFVLVGGWAINSYSAALRWPTFLFVTLLFQVFVGAACFYSLRRKEQTAHQDLLLLYADAFVYALAGYGILGDALGDYPGAFALILALAFAGLWAGIREVVEENEALQRAAGGLALFFLTITIPIQLDQGWIGIGWSVEAAVLLTLGVRLESLLLKKAGQIVWGFSLLPLLPILMGEQGFETPFTVLLLNERALPLLISALAAGWMAVVSNGGRETGDAPSTQAAPQTAPEAASGTQAAPSQDSQGEVWDWPTLFALYAVGAGAWLIAQETHLGFSWSQRPSSTTWQAGAIFVIAVLWCGYALAIFGLGCSLHHTAFRLGAFLVAAMATVVPLWASLAMPVAEWTPFWNLRSLAYLVVGLTLAALGWVASQEKEEFIPQEGEALSVLPVVVALLALWGMTLEVYFSFEQWQIPSAATWQAGAGFVIASLWSAFAVAMLLLGFTWRQERLRTCGYGVGALGTIALLGTALGATTLDWAPLANARFMAFALTTSLLIFALTAMNRRKAELNAVENGFPTTMTLLAIVILLWGLTQETYETCRYFRGALGAEWTRTAQLAISLVWTLCAALLLIGGIVRSHQPVRLVALSLLGLTVLKVFLFDLSSLDTPLRILSFGGLGLALIFISWLYSRFGVGRDAQANNASTPPGDGAAG